MVGNTRKQLDEGMMLKQGDPRMESGWRKVKLSHFGESGEWYGRVQEGEDKGKLIQFQPQEVFQYKVPSRFSDDETYELRKMDDAVQPWVATLV